MASSQNMKNLFKVPKKPQLGQLVKVLYNWGKATYSEGKTCDRPTIMEEVKYFYDAMKITDKYTFSGGSNQKLPVRTWVITGTAR